MMPLGRQSVESPEMEGLPGDGIQSSGENGAGMGSDPKRGRDRKTDILYRLCYYTGAQVIRRTKWARRRLDRTAAAVSNLAYESWKGVAKNFKIFAVKNNIPLDGLLDVYESVRAGSRRAREGGVFSLLLYWIAIAAATVVGGVKKLFSSASYAGPLAAGCVFVFVVSYTMNLTFALKVEYNGEFVGYITDESVFDEAEAQMRGRIVFEEYIRPDDTIPRFTMAVVDDRELLDSNGLTNELIQASGNELSEAYGLYVADKFLGAVADRQLLVDLLESVKDQYRTGDPDESVEFVKEVEIRDGLYPVTSVADISLIEEQVMSEEIEEQVYTAQSGDAPLSIAKKNNISYATLKSLNPDIENRLMVGQEVLVQKAVPMLEVKVEKTISYENEIPFKIEQIQDSSQYQGYVKVQQVGQKGTERVTAKVTYIDGVEVARTVLDTRTISEPITEKVVVGGKRPLSQIPVGAQTTSSTFRWPVDGGKVSCGINGYWGHTGMDIAAQAGTAVRAAASGTVTLVKYSSVGYGRHVMIDHGGGVQTLYGHNSEIYVQVGDWVEQGQLIAAVGRTGRATGNHCHFEIRINGKYMDPSKYIGTVYPY